MANVTLTIQVDTELHDAFLMEAAATQRPVAELLQELMREFVEQQRAAPEDEEYDAWFRAQVQEALDEEGPDIPHEEAMREMDRLFEEALARKGYR